MIKRADNPSKRDHGSNTRLSQSGGLQTAPQGKQPPATQTGSFKQIEVDVRFAAGELDQISFEYRTGTLQAPLGEVTEEISDIRNYMGDMRI